MFLAFALANLPLLLCLRGVREHAPRPAPATGSGATGSPGGQVLARSLGSVLGVFVTLYVLHVGVEAGVGGWEPTHLETVGYGAGVGRRRATSVYWLMMTVGRFLVAPLALRFSPQSIIAVSCAGMTACLLLAAIPGLAPYAYAGVGLFIAPIFPTGLTWLNRAAPGREEPAPWSSPRRWSAEWPRDRLLGKAIEWSGVTGRAAAAVRSLGAVPGRHALADPGYPNRLNASPSSTSPSSASPPSTSPPTQPSRAPPSRAPPTEQPPASTSPPDRLPTRTSPAEHPSCCPPPTPNRREAPHARPALTTTSDGFLLHGEPFRILSGALHYFRVHPDQWARPAPQGPADGPQHHRDVRPLERPPARARRPLVLDGGLDLPPLPRPRRRRGPARHRAPRPVHLRRVGQRRPARLARSADPGHPAAQPATRASSPRSTTTSAGCCPPLLPSSADAAAAPSSPCRWRTSTARTATTPPTSSTSRDALRRRGIDVPLFTCDQPDAEHLAARQPPRRAPHRHLRQPRRASASRTLRAHQPTGPLMCSEFWNGWFDHWGEHHHTATPSRRRRRPRRAARRGRLRQHLHVPRRHQLRLHQRRQRQGRLPAHRHVLRLRRPPRRGRRPRRRSTTPSAR